MKKNYWRYFLSIPLFLLMFSCQDEEMSNIGNSKSYSIHSSFTNQEYDLQVRYPEDYNKNLYYQTIYLLDGGWYFNELAEFIKNQYTNEVILVGIGYKNENKRHSDFTFPEDDMLDGSGDAKKFIQFLNNELIPYVENDLSINSIQKTLCGHSLAAYFSLYLLFQEDFNNPFHNIIAASPSLFWHNAYLLDLEKKYSIKNKELINTLYITMGDSEGVTMNTLFDAFNEKIESRNYLKCKFSHDRFENTVHNNNPIKSFEKGIKKLLK